MTYALATKPRVLTTPHQFDVLRIIIVGNMTDDPTLQLVDLDEILERTSKTTSKQSMQFTIRALIHNEMIEKVGQLRRRGRNRVVFAPTAKGRAIGEDKPVVPGFVQSIEEAEVEAFLAAT